MYNVWVRINALMVFSLVILGFFTFLCAMTTAWLAGDPTGSRIEPGTLYHFAPYGHISRSYGGNRANFSFSFAADFRPIFNWNVRQAFVYISAEYSTKSTGGNKSSVVIWDRVIRTDGRDYPYWKHCPHGANMPCENEACKPGLSKYCKHQPEWAHVWIPEDLVGLPGPRGLRPIGWSASKYGCKYLLKHPGYDLGGEEVSLAINYDIMPNSGSATVYNGVLASRSFKMPAKYTRQMRDLKLT